MTDIIKDAKQLLEDATPGPWVISGEFDPECPELQGAPQLENGLLTVPIISHDIYGDFFPEDGDLIAKSWTNAKALAEETWEYQVQARSMKRPAWKPSTNDVLQKWYVAEDIEEAKSKARMYTPYFRGREKVEIRVLRRRVSKPEVINE